MTRDKAKADTQTNERETMFNDMKDRYRDKFTVGYTYQADCYCLDCGGQLPEIDPEGNAKHAVATWDKAECPEWVCGQCDLPIEEWGY